MTRLQTSALGTIGFCVLWVLLYVLLRLSGIFDPYKWTMIAFMLISGVLIWILARNWRKDGAPVEIDELEERIVMKSHLWVGQGVILYFSAFSITISTQTGYAFFQHNIPAVFFGMMITIWISQSLGVLYYSARPENARVRLGWLECWLYNLKKPESPSDNHPGPGEDR